MAYLATGAARIPGYSLSGHVTGMWTPHGRIISTQVGLRATIWKIQKPVRRRFVNIVSVFGLRLR